MQGKKRRQLAAETAWFRGDGEYKVTLAVTLAGSGPQIDAVIQSKHRDWVFFKFDVTKSFDTLEDATEWALRWVEAQPDKYERPNPFAPKMGQRGKHVEKT